DVEHLRDLLVRVPEREQAHHLALAVGERVGLLAGLRFCLGRDQARSQRRVHVVLAAGDLVDGADDLRVDGLLEDVPGRSRGECLVDVPRIVLHREHEHLRLRRLLENERDAVDPALTGHDDVHQHDVRLLGARLEDRVPHVAGLADDLDVRLGVEQQLEARPEDGMVVHDQHAGCPGLLSVLLHAAGTSATTVVPAPSVDSIASLPPSSPTRSFMPTRPNPSPLPPPAPNPWPSSSITAVTELPLLVTTTLTRVASACFATFVNASC